LLNITPKDIEFHNQVVNVVKAKRGKKRRVMLDQEMLELLSDYIFDRKIFDD
jgi:integrase